MDFASIKTIRQIAAAYNHQLRADDPRFQRNVTLGFDDGTILQYVSAFILRIRTEWIAVFTEHTYGVQVFHQDDLIFTHQSNKGPIPIEELSNGS